MMFILDYLISYKTHINILGYSLFQGSIFFICKIGIVFAGSIKRFCKGHTESWLAPFMEYARYKENIWESVMDKGFCLVM